MWKLQAPAEAGGSRAAPGKDRRQDRRRYQLVLTELEKCGNSRHRLKPAAAGLRLAKTGGKTAGATSWA